jgi:hypothetical protein
LSATALMTLKIALGAPMPWSSQPIGKPASPGVRHS